MKRQFWLVTSTVLRFTAVMSFGMVLQLRMRELGASLFIIGLFSTIRGGADAFSSPIWGAISDGCKRKIPLVLLALIASGLLYPLYGIARSMTVFLILAAATGFFDACFPTVSMALITDRVIGVSSLARKMSILNTANSAGMLLGRYLLSFLFIWFSVKSTIWWFVAIIWLSLLALLPYEEKNVESRRKESKKNLSRSIFHLTSDPGPLKNNGLWAMYVGSFMRQFAIAGATSIMIIYMTEKVGISSSVAVMISGLNPLFQTFSHYFSRRVIERLGAKISAILGISMTALTPLFFALSKGGILIAAGYVSLGIAFGLFINGTGTFITSNSPEERRGEFLGLLNTARSAGVMAGPATAGIMAQYSYNGMFITMAVIMFSGSLLVALKTTGTRRENRS